jgi:uncharacterized protein YjbJ (UPF0337 family)
MVVLIDEQLKTLIMSALTEQVRGKVNQIKGKIKEEYGEATNNEMMYDEGQEEQLIGQLQETLGKTKQEVKDWIDQL